MESGAEKRGVNMELLKDFSIKDIIISEDYKNTTPGSRKMERAEQRYLQTGLLPTNIIINDDNVLIDGYITYLLAVRHGIDHVDAHRGYIEVIEAVHYACSTRPYIWRVPLWMAGTIAVNDYVIVPTSRGVKRVRVTSVMRQQYTDQTHRIKNMIKKCNR